jgi:hypothetical protein
VVAVEFDGVAVGQIILEYNLEVFVCLLVCDRDLLKPLAGLTTTYLLKGFQHALRYWTARFNWLATPHSEGAIASGRVDLDRVGTGGVLALYFPNQKDVMEEIVEDLTCGHFVVVGHIGVSVNVIPFLHHGVKVVVCAAGGADAEVNRIVHHQILAIGLTQHVRNRTHRLHPTHLRLELRVQSHPDPGSPGIDYEAQRDSLALDLLEMLAQVEIVSLGLLGESVVEVGCAELYVEVVAPCEFSDYFRLHACSQRQVYLNPAVLLREIRPGKEEAFPSPEDAFSGTIVLLTAWKGCLFVSDISKKF